MPWLALLTSMSTLICCVLPAVFVMLGFGATLVTILGEFPQLIWFSEHKHVFFVLSVLMVVATGFHIWRQRNAPCPLDPALRKACLTGRRVSLVVWLGSALILTTGITVTYVLPLI